MTRKLLNRLHRPADDGADLGGGDGGTLPSGGDAIGTGNDARVALLNQIGDSYDEIRAEDLADITDDGKLEPFSVQKPTGEEEPLEEPAPVVEPVADPEPAATPQMITRKINGKEVTKSLEDWLIAASKVESADEYLQEASLARRTALADPEPAAPQVPQRPDPREVAAREAEDRRALARAIQMGTEEEAVAAIEKLQNMAKTPTLTVEDISRVADERLKFNTALNDFRKEYSDLVSDPHLHRMVLERDAELIRSGDRRDYAERYKAVGDEVRAWRDNLIKGAAPAAPAATPVQADELATRRAAKAAAPKAPTAATAKANAPQVEPEDEDVSSVIAGMAKARGGPQWARG